MIGVHLLPFIGLCLPLSLVRASYSSSGNSCYDHRNQPQRCLPEFVNAAFNLDVEATNTCGEDGPTLFCKQTETKLDVGACQYCEKGDHPPSLMTDISYLRNQTWWQSDTMLQGIQYPTTVNLTLHLKKAYDITYVQLKFQSPRPESFAIYKRTVENGPWIPFQFYSGDCRFIFGLEDRLVALESEETKALLHPNILTYHR
uniref:Laminin N-terminal domain-containing protein n=1 Tax=Pristhesancus plagipennis TaxID=1955184 RepID=A0A2K8JPQ6_PRIPG|nr:secreted hypothetical protein [Pristhesancus plagipennis]